MKRAQEILDKYTGEVSQKDTRPLKSDWPLLLRVMDAYEEGISLSDIGYRLLNLTKENHDRNQATSNAASRLELAQRFWKKLPIHRELYEFEGRLLRPEDLEPLFPPFILHPADEIDQMHPHKMPRVALPL
jgi:hypothetical protein